MFKRILSICLVVLIVVTTFVGCNTKTPKTKVDDEQSKTTMENYTEETTTQTEEQNTITQEATDQGNDEQNGDEKQPAKNDKVTSTTKKGSSNTTTTTKPKTSTKPSTTSKPTTTTAPNTTQKDENKLVIQTGTNIYQSTPTITHSYIYPSQDKVKFTKTDSTIYENEYVKLDIGNAQKGFLLVTYKEPCAEKLWFTIDAQNPVNLTYYDSTHYRYNKSDFKVGEPIVVNLPKDDANFYIVISSEIQGQNSGKLAMELGRITKTGSVSFELMYPTEEQIKLSQVSSGVYSNQYVKINTNTASKGYVDIEYIEPNAFDMIITITAKNGKMWEYKTNQRGRCTIKGALAYGNTEYNIVVGSFMKNTSLNALFYAKKADLTVTLSNVSNTGAFLLSSGEVIYDNSMHFIKKANEIAATCSNDFEKVSKIYDWLTTYIRYEETEYTALGIYKCDLNKVYNRGTGVCYDYAVVLAAMLRSQGIPCKVVFGKYTNRTEGHVWNEVYVPSSGSIKSNELSITGNTWCRLDPTLSYGSSGQVAIDYMNNSSNYEARYVY